MAVGAQEVCSLPLSAEIYSDIYDVALPKVKEASQSPDTSCLESSSKDIVQSNVKGLTGYELECASDATIISNSTTEKFSSSTLTSQQGITPSLESPQREIEITGLGSSSASSPSLIGLADDPSLAQSPCTLASGCPQAHSHRPFIVRPGDEDLRIFCLELLFQVLLYNRDRMSRLWPAVRGHLADLVNGIAAVLQPPPPYHKLPLGSSSPRPIITSSGRLECTSEIGPIPNVPAGGSGSGNVYESGQDRLVLSAAAISNSLLLVERVFVGLLRLAMRLLRRQEMTTQVGRYVD
ncbi:unnamed protein product [Protopolystoma xenopodis]|uniref:Mon2/Sec7/BIG1-like HUS domain-containing protein n=1 Tax=Protopolystoma xenopodis TaxID=117903 RepID=A0A3S5BSJ8_9PLAT|nr:unnamed protein product [Protopolystoma xenopodis]